MAVISFTEFHEIICKSLVNYLNEVYLPMKSFIFWDITPYSPLSFNRRFGGIYRLHLQGRRKKFSKQAGGKLKRRLKLNRLHGVISQKMILFITTTVKTSNPTYLSRFHCKVYVYFVSHSQCCIRERRKNMHDPLNKYNWKLWIPV
jgi:hypothetical protein